MNSDNYPSIHWKKFFERFPEIETLQIDKWENVHIIAYFCKRYNDHYSITYSFKFNSTAPTKSYEIFQIKKLGMILSTSPIILKNYIDWWFQNKIILKKKKITSMAFLTDTNVVNDFKFSHFLAGKNIERATAIPLTYKMIVDNYDKNINTYGDLAFILKSCDENYKEMFNQLKINGMDLNILDKVK